MSMKLLRDNTNPLIFLAGFGLVTYGLWQVAPWISCTVGGAVLMAGVCVDVGLRIRGTAKERK